MLNISKTYGNVFQIDVMDNMVRATVSTSRNIERNKENPPKWANSSWRATFVGKDCYEKAKILQHGDRIIVNRAIITNEFSLDKNGEPIIDDYGKKKFFVNVVIFNFDFNEQSSPSENSQTVVMATDSDSDDLPF